MQKSCRQLAERMLTSALNRGATALLGLGLLAKTATSAVAQPVSDAAETNAWIGLVVAIVLAVAVAVVSFMSPRRGHQD